MFFFQNGADPEYRYPTTESNLEPMSAFKRIRITSPTNLKYQYSARSNNIVYFNGKLKQQKLQSQSDFTIDTKLAGSKKGFFVMFNKFPF